MDLIPTASDINEAHALARTSAETAVQHAIRCGELLSAKKEALPHGEFQAWIEANCAFAVSTAKRYMTAATQKAAGLAFSSLRHCFPSGKPQPAATEQPNAPEPEKATAESEPDEPTVDEGAEPDADEEARLNEYYAALEKTSEHGITPEVIKGLTDELANVKASRDGFMNGKTEAVTQVKRLQRANDNLERQNAALREANKNLKAENAGLRKSIRAAA